MERTLELHSQFGGNIPVTLEINTYVNNGCLYIGLNEQNEDCPEPYGDMTVNLDGKAPDYCGYVDLNNMPELEKFIEDNKIGEFTGLVKQSGFCQYPLYLFDPERLRELCPDGMAMYEHSIGKDREVKKQEKAR